MQRQVVFTDAEWKRFQLEVGMAMFRQVGEKCNLTERKSEDWWIGATMRAIESVECEK